MSTNFYIGSTPIYQQYVGSTYGGLTSRTFDASSLAFFDATGITNNSVKIAVDNLVRGMKVNSLWDDMEAIYPFVSDNTSSLDTQFKYNLKDTGSFTLTFVNGVNGDLSGYKSDSSNTKYVNTGWVPRDRAVGKNFHVSVYTTDLYNPDSPAGNAIDWGSYGSFGYSYLVTGRTFSSPNTDKIWALRPSSPVTVTSTAEAGYSIAQYNGTTNKREYFLNNATIVSSTYSPAQDLSEKTSYFGAWNNNNTVENITNKKYQFLSLGGLITSSSISTMNTLVQTFQEEVDTALGTSRAVTI